MNIHASGLSRAAILKDTCRKAGLSFSAVPFVPVDPAAYLDQAGPRDLVPGALVFPIQAAPEQRCSLLHRLAANIFEMPQGLQHFVGPGLAIQRLPQGHQGVVKLPRSGHLVLVRTKHHIPVYVLPAHRQVMTQNRKGVKNKTRTLRGIAPFPVDPPPSLLLNRHATNQRFSQWPEIPNTRPKLLSTGSWVVICASPGAPPARARWKPPSISK